MTHLKNEIRELVYDCVSYPVIHENARQKLDDQACFVFSDQEWALPDNDLIESLIHEDVILYDPKGVCYEEGEVYDIVLHNKGTERHLRAYIKHAKKCYGEYIGAAWFEEGSYEGIFDELVGRVELLSDYQKRSFCNALQVALA